MTKKEISLREHLVSAAKKRWAAVGKRDRKKHAKMMNRVRWEKKRNEDFPNLSKIDGFFDSENPI